MSARIIELSRVAAERAKTTAPVGPAASSSGERFEFWSGQSGRRYVHTVYSLILCPEVPEANYVLVHRDAHGHRSALLVGRTVHGSESLNLAEIRHRGAQLGANEVHVHLIAGSEAARRGIERDLKAAIESGHARASA